MSQLIFVSPVGVVTSLDTKRGKGIDVKKLGHAEVIRSSEIIWDTIEQKYSVKFLSLSRELLQKNEGNMLVDDDHNTRFFPDYESAVEAEVIAINKMRMEWGVDSVV
jgi:hypothetical protein